MSFKWNDLETGSRTRPHGGSTSNTATEQRLAPTQKISEVSDTSGRHSRHANDLRYAVCSTIEILTPVQYICSRIAQGSCPTESLTDEH